MARTKSGEAAEQSAEYWFARSGWKMFRTQPPVRILAYLGATSPLGRALLNVARRYLPSLAIYGQMVLGRLEAGGIADYTGFIQVGDASPAHYRACEIKEWNKSGPMKASILSPEQRAWLGALPYGCAWVGILWPDGRLRLHPFKNEGSYQKEHGIPN